MSLLTIVAYIFCLVESGFYSGWTSGLSIGGFGGLLIASLLTLLLYYCLMLCLKESVSIYPSAGGMLILPRLVFGKFGMYMVGNFLVYAYIAFAAAYVLLVVDLLKYILPLDEKGNELIADWFLFVFIYLLFTLCVIFTSNLIKALVIVFFVITIVVLTLYSVLAFNGISYDNLLDIPDFGETPLLPHGSVGIFFSLPISIIFFVGLESLGFFTEDLQKKEVNIITASNILLALLFVFFSVLIFIVSAHVGVQELKNVTQPFLMAFLKITDLPSITLKLFILFGLSFGAIGFIYASGKVIFFLSRSGYLPYALSEPFSYSESENNITKSKLPFLKPSLNNPWLAYLFGTFIGIVVTLVLWRLYFSYIKFGIAYANQLLIYFAIFYIMVSYLVFFISHLSHQYRFRTPTYNNPLGKLSSALGVTITIGMLTVFAALFLLEYYGNEALTGNLYLLKVISMMDPNQTIKLGVILGLIVFACTTLYYFYIARKMLLKSSDEEMVLQVEEEKLYIRK